MAGPTGAEVLQSNAEGVATGELVRAPGGWQTHAVLPARALGRRLDPVGLPLSTALGVYGMPGFTAYSSLHEIARLKPGETLVVAAATGPVGATVAQLAKLQGARVVAIAGGEAKRAYLQTLGVDVALDHRAADFAAQLHAAVPAARPGPAAGTVQPDPAPAPDRAGFHRARLQSPVAGLRTRDAAMAA
ncbi:hypothetical protein G6F62_013504 [Rhizopus arrhizus]|nr:hypothetical protein G6F62_013504 [Rhizopus arrhizus]